MASLHIRLAFCQNTRNSFADGARLGHFLQITQAAFALSAAGAYVGCDHLHIESVFICIRRLRILLDLFATHSAHPKT